MNTYYSRIDTINSDNDINMQENENGQENGGNKIRDDKPFPVKFHIYVPNEYVSNQISVLTSYHGWDKNSSVPLVLKK